MTDIVIVTYFYPNQVGFLDFSYRVRSLSKKSNVTLITNISMKSISEFSDIKYTEIYTPTVSDSVKNYFIYLLRVRAIIASLKNKPSKIILLGTQLSPLALAFPKLKPSLYWNEHPTHIFGRASNPIKSLIRYFFRQLLFEGARKANTVMSISLAMSDDLKLHGVDKSKLSDLAMGVDVSFVAKEDRRTITRNLEDPVSLLYCGSVSEDRGRDVMIEALSIARQRGANVTLDIVGANSEQFDVCTALIKHLDVEKYVSISGRVASYTIPSLLAKADFGICIWANHEHWNFNPPTKLFEYLVAGLPILASKIRSHTDYLNDNVDAYIFEYNPNDMANAIFKAWENRNLIPVMSHSAKKIGQKYLWSNVENDFLQIAS